MIDSINLFSVFMEEKKEHTSDTRAGLFGVLLHTRTVTVVVLFKAVVSKCDRRESKFCQCPELLAIPLTLGGIENTIPTTSGAIDAISAALGDLPSKCRLYRLTRF